LVGDVTRIWGIYWSNLEITVDGKTFQNKPQLGFTVGCFIFAYFCPACFPLKTLARTSTSSQ